MQYLLLIYENEAVYQDAATLDAIIAQHRALAGALAAEGVLRGGAGLADTAAARTVRTSRGKKMLHDGPFAETREQLGGYYLIEVADMEAALAVAERVPLADEGGIEVRPVMEMD